MTVDVSENPLTSCYSDSEICYPPNMHCAVMATGITQYCYMNHHNHQHYWTRIYKLFIVVASTFCFCCCYINISVQNQNSGSERPTELSQPTKRVCYLTNPEMLHVTRHIPWILLIMLTKACHIPHEP